jgi:hypothetical protein
MADDKIKELTEAEKAFNRTFEEWSRGRPESMELDALRIIAWEFFRRGHEEGSCGVFHEFHETLETVRERIRYSRARM